MRNPIHCPRRNPFSLKDSHHFHLPSFPSPRIDHLNLSNLTETSDCRSRCSGSGCANFECQKLQDCSLPPGLLGLDVRHNVSTTSDGLLAAPAVPDADGLTLDGDLSAECAGVAGVLRDFHLLDLLPQGGTISRDIVRLFLLLPSDSLHSSFDRNRAESSLSWLSRGVFIPVSYTHLTLPTKRIV